MKLAFIGVGTMGAPMAGRLVDAGHDVAVVDLDQDRVRALVDRGARAAAAPDKAAPGAEAVLVSLPSAGALEAAVLDPDHGVVAAMAPGSVLVDLSTNSRRLTARVGQACAARGLEAVDAPVSSVSGPPEEGKLTVMVGGDDAVVASVRPLLEAIGTNIVHLGGHGAGTVGKLITQYLGLTNMVVGMEAMLMAAKAGVDMTAMLDLVPASNGESFMFRIVRRLADEHDFGVPGQINGLVEIMNKDLGFAVELAEELGVPHGGGAAAAAAFAGAMERGYGPYHFSRVAQPLEEAAGVEIRAVPNARREPT